jgi:hypothetical protein
VALGYVVEVLGDPVDELRGVAPESRSAGRRSAAERSVRRERVRTDEDADGILAHAG